MSVNSETLFPKIQTQIAQLEVVFNGPLIKNSIVPDVNSLLTLPYNYEHKIIWVKSEESNYYLIDGDGTQLTHWKKHTNKLTIDLYQSNKTWFEGEIVYLNNKIYKALQNVPLNFNPIDYPLYWLMITGEQSTTRLIFENLSEVIVFTEIKNPIFKVFTCTFVTDINGNYILDTDGLVKLENSQEIEPYIVRRDDIPNNNGQAFEIAFEQNSQPIQLTGVINIR